MAASLIGGIQHRSVCSEHKMVHRDAEIIKNKLTDDGDHHRGQAENEHQVNNIVVKAPSHYGEEKEHKNQHQPQHDAAEQSEPVAEHDRGEYENRQSGINKPGG